MKLKHLALITASALFGATSDAQNLLSNPSFEIPTVAGDGNHIGITPTSWSVNTGNANAFNIVRSEGGSPPAKDGAQYLDLTNTGVFVTQPFTLATASAVEFGGWFSPRDGSVNVGGNVSIWNSANTVELFAAPRVTNPTAAFAWFLSSATTPSLAAGTYTFRATIDDAANVDSTFVTAVPEPATAGLAALAGLGLLGIGRRRRR